MANIKSQKKRNITNKKANLRNSSFKSKVRNAIKKVEAVVSTYDKVNAVKDLNLAISLLDKAVVKGVWHHKTVAREKSRLQLKVNEMK